MKIKNKCKINRIAIFMSIICFVTNISQLPIFVINGSAAKICIPIWIIAMIPIFKHRHKLKKQMFFLLVVTFCFLIGQCLATIINDNNYLMSSLSYPFYLSIYIFLIGYFSSDNITNRDVEIISISYIMSTVIVSYVIYEKYFRGGFNWDAIQYVYSAKNSISQIVFTAIVLLIFCYKPNKKILVVIKLLSIPLLTIFLLALKSRATILGLLVIPIVVIFFSKINKKVKVTFIFAIFIFTVLLIFNNTVSNFLVNNVLLGNRVASNLNDVSSGRMLILNSFSSLIKGNELFGVGNYYFECFYLAALLQHGYIFGMLLIVVALYPVFWAIRNLQMDKNINIMFLVIAISYCINGLFEGIAPFGPGVKCYFLWFMFGILLNRDQSYDKGGKSFD